MPPIPKKETPPPIPKAEIVNSELPFLENKPKGKFNFKHILIGTAIIALIVIVIERFVNHKTEAAKNEVAAQSQQFATQAVQEVVVQSQQFATQAVQENEIQKQQEARIQQQMHEDDAKKVAEQEKEQVKNNISSYVTADVSYSYRRIGGISDVTVNVINNTRFRIDVAIVEVKYIKADGGVWKTEQLEVSNIEAFSKKSVYAKNSDRGTQIKSMLTGISSNELGI